MILYLIPYKTRLRVRRVNEEVFAASVIERARSTFTWQCDVTHGGSVANCYGYPAATECVLLISDPFGNAVVWVARAPSNKVTERGAANACYFGSGDIFDKRITSQERKEQALWELKKEHRSLIPAMQVIAGASQN